MKSYNDMDLRCARCGGYWNDCPCDRSRFNVWFFLFVLTIGSVALLAWWLWGLS